MNVKLTPNECVAHVVRKVAHLVEAGICESCALRATSLEYKIDYQRLVHLYVDHTS